MQDDREYLIRTMLGEAARQGDEGVAAVGHVILNRAKSGRFGGSTIRDVVMAPSQFELGTIPTHAGGCFHIAKMTRPISARPNSRWHSRRFDC